MKKLFILFVSSSIVFGACQSEAPKEENKEEVTEATEERKTGLFGAEFDAANPITVADLSAAIAESDSLDNVVVRAELTEVCQKQGCWVKLKNENGDDIFVKFKDHDFLAPKDAAGRQAIVHGVAKREVTSVEELQHYAADAGSTAAEIAKITEPKEELLITATGIIIE